MIKIFNTLTRKKEILKLRSGKKINMFVCGPTVYDWPHLGHARTYIFFDMFAKFLSARGFKAFYLENITDISEKITERAKRDNKKPEELARHFEKIFYDEMAKLKINSVTRYARASDFIPEIIAQVKRLIKNGVAYAANGSVYFAIDKFKNYGKLSKQKLTKLKQETKEMSNVNRVEAFGNEKDKKNQLDFALWKKSEPGEPMWESPWGMGRPGWHIEDTAISEKFFGPQYDIHGAGIDLIFPHHECEIAQQESASGKKPFVKYWMHTGHLFIGGEKMSKSLGNFITLKDMLDKYSPEVIRFYFLKSHWQSPMDFSWEGIEEAHTNLYTLERFVESLAIIAKNKAPSRNKKQELRIKQGGKSINFPQKEIDAAFDDNFNTPKVIAILFDFIRKTNTLISANKLSPTNAQAILKSLEKLDKILTVLVESHSEEIPENIDNLALQREQARKAKNWQKADELRKEIEKNGFQVKDTIQGPQISKKVNYG